MTQQNYPNEIACPHCGQTYAVTPQQWPQYQGQTITCTKCGQAFVVGAKPAAKGPPPLPPVPPGGYAPAFAGPTAPPPRRGMHPALLVLIILAGIGLPVLVLLISILLPALNKARQAAQQVKCAANLKNIGLACQVYANSQRDAAFPDSLSTLFKAGGLPPSVLVCPASADTPSTATSSAQLAADLAAGGHCSYIYIGGLSATSPGSMVLAYDNPADHGPGHGINVLYVDGHVQWVAEPAASQLIQMTQAQVQARAAQGADAPPGGSQ